MVKVEFVLKSGLEEVNIKHILENIWEEMHSG